jgi:myo-inositol-1(or 4)-monophosphatase
MSADLLEAAKAAARAASQLLVGARATAIQGKTNPKDLVTEWDVRSEEVIRKILDERTPGIPVLGEEGGQGKPDEGRARSSAEGGAKVDRGGSSSGLRWIVDPIDGTVNFAHGLPIWSVSIAIEDAGSVLAGVVAAPALGWWFEGSKGGGARDGTGAPLRVSTTPAVEQALLVTGFPYDRATNPENNFAEWEHFQRVAGACRRLGSAALDCCMVACGWFDGYWERHLKAWDIAAGTLFVTEAGGTVTDTRGGPFDLHAGEVIASNGAIHDQLVAELGRVRSARAGSP